MVVRTATPADAPAIVDVLAASASAAYGDVLATDDLESGFLDLGAASVREWLAETADDDDVVYLVAEADGAAVGSDDGGEPGERDVVGFAQLRFGDRAPDRLDDGAAYLRSLYVHPDRWDEGHGTGLLAEGVDRLPDAATRLELSVLAENDVGKRFYERRGFERVGTGAFDIDETPYETHVYAKSLG